MKVWTAQYRYSGPDRLDITVKGKDPFGKLFAPTWEMVMGLKGGKITETDYRSEYISLLLERSREKINWADMISEDRTLVCFCKPGAFCHRVILAQFLAKAFNIVEYMGERELQWKPTAISGFWWE